MPLPTLSASSNTTTSLLSQFKSASVTISDSRSYKTYRFAAMDLTVATTSLSFASPISLRTSPPVQRRDVVDEVGLRRNEFRLEVRSLGSESVNTKLRSERADANKLWRRDGARQEFTEATTHLIVGLGPGGKVRERSIRFELEEEDWHTSFADDVIDSKVLRSFDTFVLGCYLVVLRRGEELEQEGVEGPIPVAIFCGEAINKKELF